MKRVPAVGPLVGVGAMTVASALGQSTSSARDGGPVQPAALAADVTPASDQYGGIAGGGGGVR